MLQRLKLFEDFNKIPDIWYHGSDKKFDVFNLSGINADNTDQEGPGIYLSSDMEDARGYGQYIYTVKYAPKGIILDRTMKLTKSDNSKAISIIKKYCEGWEDIAANWHENPTAGLNVFIQSVNDAEEDRVGFWQSVWFDFFRYHPQKFLEGMAANGFDGLLLTGYRVKNNKIIHTIVYNTSIIDIIKVVDKNI